MTRKPTPNSFGGIWPSISNKSAGESPYPQTQQTNDFDDYHGTRVSDPYRWLEFTQDPEVAEWLARQNSLTSEILDSTPDRDGISARLRQLWKHPRSSLPHRVGGNTFFLRTAPLENQPVLYKLADEPHATCIEILNPNVLDPNGTTALTGWAVSPDGLRVAYALSHMGGDRQDIRIRDLESGDDFPEVILWAKSEEDLPFSNVAWHPDGSGFYYSRLPDPSSVNPEDEYRFCQVWFHSTGTEQDGDELVYERPDDPDLNFVPVVTGDGRYLVLHVWKGLSNRHQVYVRPIGNSGSFSPLLGEADARYLFLGNTGDRFFFHTNNSAPRGRIIGIDLDRPSRSAWHEIIPEQADTIASAQILDSRIALVTVRAGHHLISIFDEHGPVLPVIDLPGKGTVSDLLFDARDGHLLISYESILEPRSTLRYDLISGELVSRDTPRIAFNPEAYVTRHSFVAAKDGARLPITTVHKSDLELDGKNHVLLYGYGGFNVNVTPTFDASRLLWLENGGVFTFVNLRGGGEFGEAWHEAGMLLRKQTVFDDFIASAQYMIDQGYTTGSRLAVMGESNGGLLVSACMLQRPELFGAVVCSIPVTDMLRYPKFTIGRYWVPEYGDAAMDADDFANLYAYSPLHNVRANAAYPATLVTTGAYDDRVVPAHAMKFVAALQNTWTTGSQPALLRAQPDVGHGLGKPTTKVIELDADILTFLMTACHVEWSSPPSAG